MNDTKDLLHTINEQIKNNNSTIVFVDTMYNSFEISNDKDNTNSIPDQSITESSSQTDLQNDTDTSTDTINNSTSINDINRTNYSSTNSPYISRIRNPRLHSYLTHIPLPELPLFNRTSQLPSYPDQLQINRRNNILPSGLPPASLYQYNSPPGTFFRRDRGAEPENSEESEEDITSLSSTIIPPRQRLPHPLSVAPPPSPLPPPRTQPLQSHRLLPLVSQMREPIPPPIPSRISSLPLPPLPPSLSLSSQEYPSTSSNTNTTLNMTPSESFANYDTDVTTSINNLNNVIDNILDSLRLPDEISIEYIDDTQQNRNISGIGSIPVQTITGALTNTFRRLQASNPTNSVTSINENSTLVYLQESNREQYEDVECSICNEPYQNGDILREFDKCPHYFHYSCIDNWLHLHKKCPICTTELI